MLEGTVREMMSQHWGKYGIYGIYLFRHNRTGRVLYVGQSCCPILRISQHTNSASTLRFDRFFVENRPESYGWTAEIYQVAECDWLVKTYKPDEHRRYQRHLKSKSLVHMSARIAEAAMIAHCKPPYNHPYK